MEIFASLLVGALAFAVAWFIRKPQGDGAAQAMTTELQRQLNEAKVALDSARAAHSEASQRAAAATAETKSVREALTNAEERHKVELAKVDQRRSEDLTALRDSFAKQSQDILRAMTPDVTKEVTARVEPLLAQVRTTLADYRTTLQGSMKLQDDALAGVRERMENLSKATETLATQTGDFTAVLSHPRTVAAGASKPYVA